MLPIFDDEPARPHMSRRRVCLAVLEVAGMNAHIDAPRLIQALASPLRVVRMSTVKSAEPNVHPCTNLVSKVGCAGFPPASWFCSCFLPSRSRQLTSAVLCSPWSLRRTAIFSQA